MRYTLRQLEVFLATARFENVSRAADMLSMSQSAASGALAELESQFDIQLFERHGKRLRLSELGVQLRAQAQSVLDQAQAGSKQKEPAEGIKPVHENGDLAMPFNHFAIHGHPLFICAQPRGVRL